jgi:phosphatidylinositol glycan class V
VRFQLDALKRLTSACRDVGFLRYWTPQQLPLFVLSAPVLAISLQASYRYYSSNSGLWLHLTFPFGRRPPHAKLARPFFSPVLLPYIHLHTLLTCILLFNSHVQICLRLVATNPVVFWWAATLVEADDKHGRWWSRYCSVWAPLSVVLWAGFYPPA